MAEGQTRSRVEPAGQPAATPAEAPAVTPAVPSAGAPAVLSYNAGAADPVDVEWHVLPDGVELVVPPPPAWRQFLMIVVELAAGAAAVVLSGLFVMAAAESPPGAAVLMAMVLVVVVAWWVRAIGRMVRVARLGTWATTIRTFDDRLALMSPWLPGGAPVELPREVITGLRLNDEGLPPLIRFLRLRVILGRDAVVTLRFPWCGGESAMQMELRLRAALGFGPRNFSRNPEPRVPPGSGSTGGSPVPR